MLSPPSKTSIAFNWDSYLWKQH